MKQRNFKIHAKSEVFKKTKMKKSAAFTLIEILITMTILSVGLLGLAGLQATSLKTNQSAYSRSQATQLAYDMADRIRANPAESSKRADANPNTLANSVYVMANIPNPQPSCGSSPGCIPALMAQNDLAQWFANIRDTLPNGRGSVAVDANTRIFTITVTWDDNRDGIVDGKDPNFVMSFQI